MLEVLRKRSEGTDAKGYERRTPQELDVCEACQQGWIRGDVWRQPSIRGRSVDDRGAHHENGIEAGPEIEEGGMCSPQGSRQAEQLGYEFGTSDTCSTQPPSCLATSPDTTAIPQRKVCVNSPCSLALVAEYLEATSSDGDAFAPSNGNPIPQAYLSPDRMKAFSRLSRFGMTCEPLTENLGAELLTWFLEGFPVKTSALPERERVSTVNDPACGKKWRGSLAKYDPDTRSWRTAQFSLHGGLELFSETWPRWGTMRSGECSEQTTPVLRIKGSASRSLLPTPLKSEGRMMTYPDRSFLRDHSIACLTEWCVRSYGMRPTPESHEILMPWPIGWTALPAQGTDKFQRWCALHGIPSTPESNEADAA